jgi:hypothetical protein
MNKTITLIVRMIAVAHVIYTFFSEIQNQHKFLVLK